MSRIKTLTLACLFASPACLVAGFVNVAWWASLLAGSVASLAWLLAWYRSHFWPPSAALVVNIALASAGLLSGVSPFSMLLCAVLAIAAWDLLSLEQALGDSMPGQAAARLEKAHLESLALALGIGLVAAAAGSLVHFRLPFAAMVLLVVLALLSLELFWRLLNNW
jgi:hypothetical protein